MASTGALTASRHDDHAALFAAAERGAALCTIVAIDGSFSRRVGAQLAVLPDGSTVGSLSDGCLERQLASDARDVERAEVRRYGAGSPAIDFRLPCGSGLDILIDPAPNRDALQAAQRGLLARRPAQIDLPDNPLLDRRGYLPEPVLRIFGSGPEVESLDRIAQAANMRVDLHTTDNLALGHASGLPNADAWTAVVLLFHDHEWELALVEEALASEAFFIGAQGGAFAREQRTLDLLARGVDEAALARLRSPVGVLPHCKTPGLLALSVLAEIAGAYEALRSAN